MSYIPTQFKLVGETVDMEFDFQSVMRFGETLNPPLIASVAVTLASGQDSSPSLILTGGVTVSGAVVKTKVTAGMAGVIYILTFHAAGSSGAIYRGVRYLTILADEGSYVPASIPTLTGDLPDGVVGVAYSNTLDIAGGYEPYEYFQISAGTAPPWMGFSVVNRTLICAGLPDEEDAINYTFTVSIRDAAGTIASSAQMINISRVTISGDLGDQFAFAPVSYSYTATDGTPPYTFAITAGSLPTGLSMNTAGEVSGMCTVANTFNWTVSVTDANGVVDTLNDTCGVTVIDVGAEWDYTGIFGKQLRYVTNGEGTFLAVGHISGGNDKQLWTSTTGEAWVQQTTGAPAAMGFESCAYGNGTFIASADTNKAVTGILSGGIISWTLRTTANSNAYLVTVWSGTNFIRAGFGTSSEWSSNSGVSWNNVARPSSTTVRNAVVFNNSRVLFFSDNGTIHYTDNHGVSYATASVTADPIPATAFTGSATDGTVIRAFKHSAGVLYTYTSTDGGNIFTVSQFTAVGQHYSAGHAMYQNGRWVGLGEATTGGEQVKLWISPDGLPPWTQALVAHYTDTTAASMLSISGAYNRAVLVGTKASDGYAMTSPLLSPP